MTKAESGLTIYKVINGTMTYTETGLPVYRQLDTARLSDEFVTCKSNSSQTDYNTFGWVR